jgi:hypothetical protein
MLKGLLAGVPLAAGAAVATSASFVRNQGQKARESVEQRLEDLKRQFEDSEQRNRKLIRIALAGAALSLGFDLSALL